MSDLTYEQVQEEVKKMTSWYYKHEETPVQNSKKSKIDELLNKIDILDKKIQCEDFHDNDDLNNMYYGHTKSKFKIELLKMHLELFTMKEDLK